MSIRSKHALLGLGLSLFAPACGAEAVFAQDLVAAKAERPLPDLPKGLRRAEVMDGWQMPDGTRMAAIRVTLDQGWKTYWRHPGDAGIPPSFNFKSSSNLAHVKIFWPRPQVFRDGSSRSIGYKNQMILPIAITPEDPHKPVRLEADLDLGICHDICIPVSLELGADLQGTGQKDPLILAALAAQPVKVASQARCVVEPISDGMRVTARLPAGPQENQIALFELISHPVWVSDSHMGREGDMLVATADFVPPEAQPFDLPLEDLRITVLDPHQAIEMDGCSPQL